MSRKFVVATLIALALCSSSHIARTQEIRWQPIDAGVCDVYGDCTGVGIITDNFGSIGVPSEIVIPGGSIHVRLDVFLSDWWNAAGAPDLGAFQATLEADTLASGEGAPLSALGWPGSPEDGAYLIASTCILQSVGRRCSLSLPCDAGGICVPNPDWTFVGLDPTFAVSTTTLDYEYGCTSGVAGVGADKNAGPHAGTLIIDVPVGAVGTYTVNFNPSDIKTWMCGTSCTNRITGLVLTPALITILDCNDNGVPDGLDVANGTSLDCNGNIVPDECDVTSGASADCNGNGVPDECEVDCNENAVPDACDIASGTSEDSDGDGVPNECDVCPGIDDAEFQVICLGAIPTVSTWGLIALVLLLLTLAKVYFGRGVGISRVR